MWLAHIDVPEAGSQAMRYYESGNILWILQWAWTLVIPLILLVSGFSGKLSKFAAKHGKNRIFSYSIYLIIFVALYQLLSLPLEFYAGYLREHAYGLSTQSIGRWFENFGKWSIFMLMTSWAFIWMFYLLLKKSPSRWWIYTGILSVSIAFIMMFIQPIWIDPLFNQFEPLKNKQLKKQILDLASRAGIENGRVFEVDKSKDTKMCNAYVAGLGSTQRIIIWDTTLQKNNTDALLFIMGHEMGHYVLHHAWYFLGYFTALAFVISYLTYRVANFLVNRYQDRFGFQKLSDIASLPLFLFLASFFILLSTPIFNYFNRYVEREADRFGIEITHNNKAAAALFADAVNDHLVNPRPGIIYTFWRSHHPSIGDRIDFCNSYHPWLNNEPLVYGEYFRVE